MSNKLVRNEQRKLSATYFNGAALAVMGVGGFTPIVAVAQSAQPSLAAFAVVIGCMLASARITLACPTRAERVGRMNDLAFLSLYGVFFAGLAAVVAFVLYLNRQSRPHHPAAGE